MKVDRDDIRVQAAIFVFCGMFSAASYSAVIFALVELGRIDTVLATTAGFVVGTVVSFVLNSALTFRRRIEGRAFGRFWIVTGLGWLLNIGLVEGAQVLGLHYAAGVAAALVAAPTFNFLGHRWWTFRV